MSLRTKFYTLWKGCFDNSFNGVLFLHPLFVQNWVRISHHSYAVQARSQGRCNGSWSWNTIIGSVSLLQLVMLFQDAQRTIYTCFSMPVCVGTNTDIETKRTRPPEVIFTHHLPEALQNYFNCAKISTKKRSHKSVKMVRSSFGRMPVGCSNNRLCYGSIFYF